MLLRILLLWFSLAATKLVTAGYVFGIVPKTADNPFFVAAYHGCRDFCQGTNKRGQGDAHDQGCSCSYGGVNATAENPNPDPDGSLQVAFVQQLLQQEQVDAMAISVKNETLMTPLINQISQTMPVLTFDSDAQASKRLTYVGTDNFFMGQTMAKTAKQVTPTGGTFAVVYPDDSPNIHLRWMGIINEMQSPEGLWQELTPESPIDYGRDLDQALAQLEQLAQQPDRPTIIFITSGGPLFHSNYTDFAQRNQHRNITIVSADDFDLQLQHLSKGHVHGLVGQIPYEMGYLTAQLLYQFLPPQNGGNSSNRNNNSQLPPTVGTNLITHTHVPLTLPYLEVDHNLIGGPLLIVGYTLLGTTVFTALACGAWTYMGRNKVVVQAAQPVFLIMIAVGIIVLATTIVPLSMDDGGEVISEQRATWICMSAPWLCCFGFTVTFSALLSKTIRINRILEETRAFHRVTVSPIDVLAPFSILLTLNGIILTLWSVLDPLMYVRSDNKGLDGWGRVISTYGRCECDNAWRFVAPLCFINICTLILANWQAYRSRKIKSEFAESKYIAMCMLLLLEALLLGVPVFLVVQDDSPEALYLTVCLMIFVVCMGVLLLIFLPKMVLAADYSQRSEVEQRRLLLSHIRESAVAAAEAAAAAASGTESTPKGKPGSSTTAGDQTVDGVTVGSK